MKWGLTVLVLAFAGCGDDPLTLPEEQQGVCKDLDVAACKADSRCQQAYEDSGFQPMPNAVMCLLVRTSPATTAACETLSFDGCRARSDCSPLYWQELGPNDGAVGDPYYSSCLAEPTF